MGVPLWPDGGTPVPDGTLLQHKSSIALGCYLGPFGSHHRGTVWTGEQEPGFARNVRAYEPRVGLGAQNLRTRLRGVLGPGGFGLRCRRNALQLMLAHIADAVAHPVHQRLSGAHEVAD